MRIVFRVLVFCLALWTGSSQAGAQEQPDIVIYLSDDHSQADASLYGNAAIPTPHMEQLANDGISLTHAFVASPSCAPSRAAMLTALWPARNGAEGNHTFPDAEVDRSRLISRLQETGYEVAAFGKVAHGQTANSYGFDYVDGAVGNGDPLAGRVEDWLSNRTSTKPLCLFVGTSDPHVIWTSPSSFEAAEVELPPPHLDTPSTRAHRARYYEEIKELDELLGQLRTLAAEHLTNNLLFIHTSDHGAQWAFGKWTLYDYGVRVPFVAAWPGHIPANTSSAAMVSWLDLLPTVVDIAGGEEVAESDGTSFRAVLEGTASAHREQIFTTHTSDQGMNAYPSRSVRTGEWKLIRNFRPDLAFTTHTDLNRKPWAGAYWSEWVELARENPDAQAVLDRYYQRPEFELYHLPTDPWEMTNLAMEPDHEDVLTELTAVLADWMAELEDEVTLNVLEHPLNEPETWDPDFQDSFFQNGGFSSDNPLQEHFVAKIPTAWRDGGPAVESGADQDFLELFDGESGDQDFRHPLGGQGNSSVDLNGRMLEQTVTGLIAGKNYHLSFLFLNAEVAEASLRSGEGSVLDSGGEVLASVSSQGLAGQEFVRHTLDFEAPLDGEVTVRFRTTQTTREDSGIQVDDVTLLLTALASVEPANLPEDLFLDSFDRSDSLEHGLSRMGMSGSRLDAMPEGNFYYHSWEAVGSTEILDCQLLLAKGPGMSETAVRHNFVGPDILDAGGFVVQLEVGKIEASDTELPNRYSGFGVGLSQAEAEVSDDIGDIQSPGSSFRGRADGSTNGTADFFLELDKTGQVKAFSNGEPLGEPVPVGPANTQGILTVDFSFTSFSAGAPVEVNAFFDGQLVDLNGSDTGAGLSFVWQWEESNYIGLSGRANTSCSVDNLAIRTGPVSTSLAAGHSLRSGLLGMVGAPGVDGDGDGSDNFTEWLTGSDPGVPDVSAQLLELAPTTNGRFTFQALHLQEVEAAELNYRYLYSLDLQGDYSTWIVFEPELLSTEASGPAHELLTWALPADLAAAHERLFVMLVVE